MVLTKEGKILALDAKMSFDDNALYRHPELEALRDAMRRSHGAEAAQNELSTLSWKGILDAW